MKEKQQSKEELTTGTNSLPFEKELISLTKTAIVNGYSQSQVITILKQYWNKNLPDLPVENEDEIAFREKVERFMNAKYEEFDVFSYKHQFKGQPWLWTKTDKLSAEIKRKLIYEVCCTIYKGFKMDTFDRDALKKVNVERTKMMFPELKGHTLLYYLVLIQLLGYASYYEVEDEKKDALDNYLSKFELHGKDDEDVVKFVWIVENFD